MELGKEKGKGKVSRGGDEKEGGERGKSSLEVETGWRHLHSSTWTSADVPAMLLFFGQYSS